MPVWAFSASSTAEMQAEQWIVGSDSAMRAFLTSAASASVSAAGAAAAVAAEKDKVANVAPVGTRRLERLNLLRLDANNHQHHERR